MRVIALAAMALCVLAAAAACDEDFADCYPGDYRGCTCPNGAAGYAACTSGAYGSCVCDGQTPGIDAGSCTTAADCPVDGSVCTNRGVCRGPS